VSDKTAIEWTEATWLSGRDDTVALFKRPGECANTPGAWPTRTLGSVVSISEFTRAPKRCSACKQEKPRDAFAVDRSRPDGRTYWCRDCRNDRANQRYQPRPRPQPGRRFVSARDGDQLQARRRVNYLVEAGLIPAPNTLPCVDCGHEWLVGERRHEYDHHLGYAPEHHEDVEAVCSRCHHEREIERGAA
jgi:hypothetical protein